MTTEHKLNNHPIHTSCRIPQKQPSTVWVSRGCQEAHSNVEGLLTFPRDYRTLSVWPFIHSWPASLSKATSADVTIEASQWPLSASHSRACHSVTVNTQQDVLPQAATSTSSSPACKGTVKLPPEALLTAWSNWGFHDSWAPQVILLPAVMTPPHGRLWWLWSRRSLSCLPVHCVRHLNLSYDPNQAANQNMFANKLIRLYNLILRLSF